MGEETEKLQKEEMRGGCNETEKWEKGKGKKKQKGKNKRMEERQRRRG